MDLKNIIEFFDNCSDFDLCIYYIDQCIMRYEFLRTFFHSIDEKYLSCLKFIIDEFKALKSVIVLCQEERSKNE